MPAGARIPDRVAIVGAGRMGTGPAAALVAAEAIALATVGNRAQLGRAAGAPVAA